MSNAAYEEICELLKEHMQEEEIRDEKGVEKTDLYQLHLLSGLKASPSGNRLVYVHTQMAEASDTYEKNLWLLEGKRNFCIYQKQKFSAFLWENEHTLLIQKPAKEQKTEFVRLHLDTLCTTPAFTIPANVVQLERISVQHYAYLAEESVQKQNDDDTIVLTQIPFWDNGVGYISGKRNHLYVYYEESQTSKALFAGNWHVETCRFQIRKLYVARRSIPQRSR